MMRAYGQVQQKIDSEPLDSQVNSMDSVSKETQRSSEELSCLHSVLGAEHGVWVRKQRYRGVPLDLPEADRRAISSCSMWGSGSMVPFQWLPLP